MPLPTLDKAWQYNANNLVTSAGESTFYGNLLRGWKNAMKGFGLAPWTVAGSSDAVTAGMDAVDRWIDNGDLVIVGIGGGNRSWIVLENADGVQLLWHLSIPGFGGTPPSAYAHEWLISLSAGFTGGSISARPTATDEIPIFVSSSGGLLDNQQGTVIDHRWHMWHSNDGLITRCSVFRSGVPTQLWSVERLKNPAVGHTVPVGYRYNSVGSSPGTNRATRINMTNDAPLRSRIGSTNINLLALVPGRDTAVANSIFGETFAQVADETDGGLYAYEIPLITSTLTQRGPKGLVYDMWWGQVPPAATGDHYPLTPAPTREFVQIGHYIFPWNGTVIQTS